MKHVRDVGRKEADDKTIWDWAKAHAYSVIATDFDFVGMSQRFGSQPKVIQIARCDFPFVVIEQLLRCSAVLISEFDKDEAAGLLTLPVPPVASVDDESRFRARTPFCSLLPCASVRRCFGDFHISTDPTTGSVQDLLQVMRPENAEPSARRMPTNPGASAPRMPNSPTVFHN